MAREAVVCPRCGALNRPTWPFCARCNESLEGAQAAAPADEAETRRFSARIEPATGPSPSISATSLLLLLAIVGSGFWAWRSIGQPAPARPDPALFSIGESAPAEPSSPPRPLTPGAEDFVAGRALALRNDFAAALPRLAAAVGADPRNATYRSAYADVLWRSGDHDSALREQSDAANLDPRLRADYARMLEQTDRTEDAVREYETVLAENPQASDVEQDLGRLLFRTGDFANAAEHLQAAVRDPNADLVLQQELAYALDQAGDRAQATEVYRRIIQRAPWASLTVGLLSESLYQQGSKEEAISVLREGIENTPESPLLQRQLGSLLERSGQRQQAAAAYRSYVELAPNAADAKDIEARAKRLGVRRRSTAGETP